MLRRRIIAVLTTLALALGMSVGGAGTAFANGNGGGGDDNMNTAAFYENNPDYPGVIDCYYYGDGQNGQPHGYQSQGGVVLNPFVQSWPGDRWELLVVKGGPDRNIYTLPTAGQVYYAPNNPSGGPAGVSHWIVCKGLSPQPEDKVVVSDWQVGSYECGDTTVEETQSTSTTPYKRVNNEWVEGETTVTTETRTRALTPEEIAALDCTPTLGTASVAFTFAAPQCDVAQTVSVNALGGANATLVSTDTSVAGQVTFVFAAAEDTVFNESEPPVFTGEGTAPAFTATLSNNNETLTVVVTLLPADDELCEVPVNLVLTYMVDCVGDQDNTWRVRNPSNQEITVSWYVYNGVEAGTHQAPPGDSFFSTSRAKNTMIIEWGGGDTGVVAGKTQKAAGNDRVCAEPTLEGSIATTACETDVPYILFSISLNDPDNQSTAGLEDAEIIFSGLDSEGNEREYVLDNLEGTLVDGVFSGRVLWPGAAIEDGQAAGWPGWALVDGEWQNVGDDNFGWTRGLDSVTLSVNPTLEVELSYPAATPECATEPTAVEPTIEYSYSCDFGGTIELSDTPGVIWTVDGEQTDQRVWTGLDIDFAPVITASLDPEMIGMYFGPEAMTGTTVEFELPEEGCDLVTSPLVTPTLSTTQATCTTAGSYTLNAIEGVQWLVNGQVTAPGTYTATTGSTVEVEAVALQGFGFGFETQTEWTLSFPAPAGGCVTLTDLPTLALTGASGMLGTVGIIALLITLTGIGAVVARRRVEA